MPENEAVYFRVTTDPETIRRMTDAIHDALDRSARERGDQPHHRWEDSESAARTVLSELGMMGVEANDVEKKPVQHVMSRESIEVDAPSVEAVREGRRSSHEIMETFNRIFGGGYYGGRDGEG